MLDSVQPPNCPSLTFSMGLHSSSPRLSSSSICTPVVCPTRHVNSVTDTTQCYDLSDISSASSATDDQHIASMLGTLGLDEQSSRRRTHQQERALHREIVMDGELRDQDGDEFAGEAYGGGGGGGRTNGNDQEGIDLPLEEDGQRRP